MTMYHHFVGELAIQLEEDVRALSELLWRRDPLPPSHVRVVASAMLRKWLIDGNLTYLANTLGSEFTLPLRTTEQIAEVIDSGAAVSFFMAGGVMLDGVPIRGFYVSDTPPSDAPIIPIDGMEWKHLSPKKFLHSKRIYHSGQWFNVEQILRFVANKVGGVHFDSRRDHAWQSALEEAGDFFSVGDPDRVGTRQLLETYSPKHQILLVLPKEAGYRWSCLDIELLSIAQSLINVHVGGEPMFEIREDAFTDRAHEEHS